MKSLGIDPGNSGALCLFDGVDLIIYDMPTTTTDTGRKTKKGNAKLTTKVNAEVLARLLRVHGKDISACVEKVSAMPPSLQGRTQGVSSSFNFGRSLGVIEGVLSGLGIPYDLVQPAEWKRKMEVTSDKDLTRQRAATLFPRQTDYFKRAMDDGRAEAALLALYWWNRRERLPH